MNRYQKIAWFNLTVIAATIIVTATAIAVEFHMRGYSTIGPFFVGILALLKFTPYLFKKPQSRSGVVCDERDDLILTRAVSSAWAAFWWVFIGSCFLLWFIIGPENSVPTITLPLMALGGGLFHKAACSVGILIRYGRTDPTKETSHE
jgi:hypothetical protein